MTSTTTSPGSRPPMLLGELFQEFGLILLRRAGAYPVWAVFRVNSSAHEGSLGKPEQFGSSLQRWFMGKT